MNDNTTLAIDGLAVHRITRLLTRDTFPPVRRAREALLEWFPPDGALVPRESRWTAWSMAEWADGRKGGEEPATGEKVVLQSPEGLLLEGMAHASGTIVKRGHPIGELISCPWCSGFWVAVGVVVARRFVPRVWGPLAKALAFSSAAGILSGHEG